MSRRSPGSASFFSADEFAGRIAALRRRMTAQHVDISLVSSPENIYYLTGLDHQGYFAYQMLVIPLEGKPVFISRAMEKATVRDQIPGVRHVGYSDGIEPLPSPSDREDDLVFATRDESGDQRGLRPWEMSAGVSVRGPVADASDVAVSRTVDVLLELGSENANIGIEKSSSFFPFRIAEGIISGVPGATWINISGMVEDCRIIQSPRELECTRKAAEISDAMMLSAIAAAGAGMYTRDVVAASYDAMFRRGGTYPGFVPLVRSTRTLEHEHGTWQSGRLRKNDILFLEMAGCVRRYHAPMGRLVFIGKARKSAYAMQTICLEAMHRAADALVPGAKAGEVYREWQSRLDEAGLTTYKRHHCGYAVGIGFPPSWSGSGPPQGLRADSGLEIRPGMVFHLMSWLLRTGRGDSFLSDPVVVTEKGCEFLTTAGRGVTVR
jgi:Xaa-Pro dipeptidase